MENDELRAWAAAHPLTPQAAAVLQLIGENDLARTEVARLRIELVAATKERDVERALVERATLALRTFASGVEHVVALQAAGATGAQIRRAVDAMTRDAVRALRGGA